MKVGDLVTWKGPALLPQLVQLGIVWQVSPELGLHVWVHWPDNQGSSVERKKDLKVINECR